MSFTYHFQVDATLVSNEFIDRYLAEANGEYVKVYLYLLRHKDEPMSPGDRGRFKPYRGRYPACAGLLGKAWRDQHRGSTACCKGYGCQQKRDSRSGIRPDGCGFPERDRRYPPCGPDW